MTQPTLQHIVYPFLARLSLFDFSSDGRAPHHVSASVPVTGTEPAAACESADVSALHSPLSLARPSQARQSGLMTGVAEAALTLRPAFENALSLRNARKVGLRSHQRGCFVRCLSPSAAVSSRIVNVGTPEANPGATPHTRWPQSSRAVYVVAAWKPDADL